VVSGAAVSAATVVRDSGLHTSRGRPVDDGSWDGRPTIAR
jgi:hypothetical protein